MKKIIIVSSLLSVSFAVYASQEPRDYKINNTDDFEKKFAEKLHRMMQQGTSTRKAQPFPATVAAEISAKRAAEKYAQVAEKQIENNTK